VAHFHRQTIPRSAIDNFPFADARLIFLILSRFASLSLSLYPRRIYSRYDHEFLKVLHARRAAIYPFGDREREMMHPRVDLSSLRRPV